MVKPISVPIATVARPTCKGLRQGDSLSPYLFLLVVEILSKLLNDAVERGQITGFKVADSGTMISHLQFADDTLIFINATVEEARRLFIILTMFETLTGLKLNFDKSTMVSVGADEIIEDIARELGCKTEKLPIKYLGMAIGANWRCISVWDSVIERMEQKLATWKKNFLNKAGRLVLIKSCLASLPVYYLSLFHLPVGVENKMISIMRNFLWGAVEGKRKMAWVAWHKLCIPKVYGGVGIKNLRLVNKALLSKWVWRYSRSKNALWRRIVQQKFKVKESILMPDTDDESQCRSLWKNACNMVPELQKHSEYTVGNGQGIRFWHDNWSKRGCLKDIFPVLYKACDLKQATISEMAANGVWMLCGFSRRLNANERLEWDLLRRDYRVPVLVNDDDEVKILQDFSTSSCYNTLVGELPSCWFQRYLWRQEIPNNVSFLLWAVFHNSLPTRCMLVRRGINLNSDLCVLCNSVAETDNHLLLHCSYSFDVWDHFIKAFGISWPLPETVLQLFDAWEWNVLRKKGREVWKILHYAVLWVLWLERNNRVYGGKHKSVYETIINVKQTVVLWSCNTEIFRYLSASQILHSWETVMQM